MNTNSTRFDVFFSAYYRTGRLICICMPLVCIYVAWETTQLWMLILIIPVIAVFLSLFLYLSAFVRITDTGLYLHRILSGPVYLAWSDILCCGTFRLNTSKADGSPVFIYFSRKPIEVPHEHIKQTLFKPSNCFIFIELQPRLYATIKDCWKDHKLSLVAGIDSAPAEDYPQSMTLFTRFRLLFVIGFALSVFFLYFSNDIRWGFASLVFGILFVLTKGK